MCEIEILTQCFEQNFFLVIGLGLDMLGALFLAKAFMTKSLDQISSECISYWGFSSALFNSLIQQKEEAKAGFVLLTLGFSAQAIPYLVSIEHLRVLGPFLCFIPVVGYVLWRYIPDLSKKKQDDCWRSVFRHDIEKKIRERHQIGPADAIIIKEWTRVANTRPKSDDESSEEFLSRVRGALMKFPYSSPPSQFEEVL